MGNELVTIKPIKPPSNLKTLSRDLAKAKTPEEVLKFERWVAGMEAFMRKAGYSQGDIHEVNEARMRARWRLGQMLAPSMGKRGGSKYRAGSLKVLLSRLKLDIKRAIEAQRIGTLPKLELERIFQRAREMGELVTIQWLVDAGRPYWYKEARVQRHREIREKALELVDVIGPFPVIYADPPWRFKTYSEKGTERTADQHYPTLSLDEIKWFSINGQRMDVIAHEDAALLLWCTSSNMPQALEVMEAWGFTFKASAVWVKMEKPEEPLVLTRQGLGLVFRNMHEVLLYGTRGNMPGPQYQPPSVFWYPRGRHSAKPPEIRQEIEKMYPHFGASTRLEMFGRESVEGWTTYGYESARQAAE